ncbi:MAG TPA: T9SS type A sorting domain-containing protein [Ignavibacteriaceae bacterium]|nr:T9SS type A sorting domain-containing protein [Ignavibacteriaceae bacterium]
MKKSTLIIIFLFINSLLSAQTLSKVYVLSEGGFSPGSSKLSLLDNSTSQFNTSIFSPGAIGLYPDGLIVYKDNLYLTEQGSYGAAGKIYKLDTNGVVQSFTSVGTNPYSLAIANNKIYITNGPASNVSVINMNDFPSVKTINVGVYPQEILSVGDYVFVANTSLYGGAVDSTVSVIDSKTDSVITVINVGKDPSSLASDGSGKLFVGVPGDGSTGRIIVIDTTSFHAEKVYSIPGQGFGSNLNVASINDDFYFISYNNDIVSLNKDDSTIAVCIPSVFPNNYYYGYAYDFSGLTHYVLDAKSFTVTGSLTLYENNGTMKNSYSTGIAPRRVVLKYTNSPSSITESNIVSEYSLEQNYPNPFNPETAIKFSIPSNVKSQTSKVKLIVYDILGNEAATLVNEHKSPGNYEVKFNANSLTSGVYIYRLSYEGQNVARKMILQK